MNTLRIPEPKQTSSGSMLYYSNNGKLQHMEFPTDEEATEFADVLRAAREREEEKWQRN